MAGFNLKKCLILLLVLIFIIPLIYQNALAADGYWDLTEVKPKDACGESNADWTYGVKEMSDGCIVTYTMATFVSPNSYYERIGTWASPPGTLVPGETLTITFKLKNGEIRNPVHSEGGQVLASLGYSLMYDSNGYEALNLDRDKGVGAEVTKALSAPVPGFMDEGLVLRIWCGSGSGAQGEVHYIYSWREGTPPSDNASDSLVNETQWCVNNAPVYWLFHENGTVEAPGQWEGTWELTDNGYLVNIVHQGISDSFIVIFSADGQSFTAYKNGSEYRYGVRVK